MPKLPVPVTACDDWEELEICISERTPEKVSGWVQTHNGKIKTAVSIEGEGWVTPERVENIFFRAVREVRRMIAVYGPEGNVPPGSAVRSRPFPPPD